MACQLSSAGNVFDDEMAGRQAGRHVRQACGQAKAAVAHAAAPTPRTMLCHNLQRGDGAAPLKQPAVHGRTVHDGPSHKTEVQLAPERRGPSAQRAPAAAHEWQLTPLARRHAAQAAQQQVVGEVVQHGGRPWRRTLGQHNMAEAADGRGTPGASGGGRRAWLLGSVRSCERCFGSTCSCRFRCRCRNSQGLAGLLGQGQALTGTGMPCVDVCRLHRRGQAEQRMRRACCAGRAALPGAPRAALN